MSSSGSSSLGLLRASGALSSWKTETRSGMSSSLSLEMLLAGRLGCEQVGVIAHVVGRAGEGLELVDGALVGGMGGHVVMEEEFAGREGGEHMLVVWVAELSAECGSVLFRLWSVVARVCRRCSGGWSDFRGGDDGGDKCVVNHLVSLVGDVRVVVGTGMWWIAWAGCGGVLGVVSAVVRGFGGLVIHGAGGAR